VQLSDHGRLNTSLEQGGGNCVGGGIGKLSTRVGSRRRSAPASGKIAFKLARIGP